jgi:hypothetical protein
MTRMSGRLLLPFRVPVFSEPTMPDMRHMRRVWLNTSAKASLMVCSVVAMGFPPLGLSENMWVLHQILADVLGVCKHDTGLRIRA